MIPSSDFPRIILASSSAYRRALLERLRLAFEVAAPDIDETPLAGETPDATALRLAREKAAAVAAAHPGALVIGSDQVATLDGAQIGKPGDHARALEQLRAMRGREVVFHTALCLWDDRSADPAAAAQMENVQTLVSFRDLPDAELDAYLRIEQPYDCAGSAKNEGLGIALLARIDSSDPTALTGLPLIALTSMLRRAGVPFFLS
jgi:septum formation protein